jgi:hypothetical protein
VKNTICPEIRNQLDDSFSPVSIVLIKIAASCILE